MIRHLGKILINVGVNPLLMIKSIRGIPQFVINFFTLKKQLKESNEFKIKSFFPQLADRFMEGGVMRGHYYHQDLFVAQKIYDANPNIHVDIGSRIDGFVAHVASFREIKIFDIRDTSSKSRNIVFERIDFTDTLNDRYKESVDSISSLHAIEHFGLGRYGDKIDVNGHLKGLENIYFFLKPKGIFYFSTPIGSQRIEFDAHRVFNVGYLLKYFEDKYSVVSFSYVNDAGEFFENVQLKLDDININYGCMYGCGIFELEKR